MAENKLSKYQQVQAEREALVNKALEAQEARDALHAAAAQGEKDYAAVIAQTLKGGVSAEDLKLVGVEVPEVLPKRVSKQRKPLEVPAERRPRPSQTPEPGPEDSGE